MLVLSSSELLLRDKTSLHSAKSGNRKVGTIAVQSQNDSRAGKGHLIHRDMVMSNKTITDRKKS